MTVSSVKTITPVLKCRRKKWQEAKVGGTCVSMTASFQTVATCRSVSLVWFSRTYRDISILQQFVTKCDLKCCNPKSCSIFIKAVLEFQLRTAIKRLKESNVKKNFFFILPPQLLVLCHFFPCADGSHCTLNLPVFYYPYEYYFHFLFSTYLF